MSTVSAPPAGLVDPAVDPAADVGEELRVYGHNNILYWWPVWALGFLFAALTYADGHVMAVVPEGTQVEQARVVPGDSNLRNVLVAPPGQAVTAPDPKGRDHEPHLRVAANNNYGVVFIGAILFVILATNLTLRGMASVIAIAFLIILVLFLWVMNWWDPVLLWLGGLDVAHERGRLPGRRHSAVHHLALLDVHLRPLHLPACQPRAGPGPAADRRGGAGGGRVRALAGEEVNDFFRHWIWGSAAATCT